MSVTPRSPVQEPEYTCGKARFRLATVKAMCPGTPEANLRANLPPLFAELEARGLGDDAMARMAIATVYVETGRFAPLSELPSRFNTSPGGRPFDLYDERRDLGNTGHPDGATFRGRGYVQLTGRANYVSLGKRLGMDLVTNPEVANDPSIAAAILAEFLKEHEPQIRAALAMGDLARARKLVNGGSHGLDVFSKSYLAGESRRAA